MATDEELLAQADDMETQFRRRMRSLEKFRYDEVQGKYWDIEDGRLLEAKSVNGAVPREDWPTFVDGEGRQRRAKPADAINAVETGLTVETSTWWPGKSQFIENVVMTDRGPLNIEGAVTLNTYHPPSRANLRTDRNPDRWLQHVKLLFPDPVEWEHFFDWAAHTLQFPHIKINHGIVMAGHQGIGKDTALLPVREGVGEHNVAEIGPDAVFRPWNDYVRSVLVMINEVRPEAEEHRASNFYNILKPLMAAPPNLLALEMKYANRIYIANICRVLMTTNEPLGMYIPAEDRRLFVMTSPLGDPKKTGLFGVEYFNDMHRYLADGGADAVIRWLLNRDVSKFDPASAPPMTAGKQAIIDATSHVRTSPVDDFIDRYLEEFKRPDVIFGADLAQWLGVRSDVFDDEELIRKGLSAKNFHYKMDEHGYTLMRCQTSAQWTNKKFRSRAAYVRKGSSAGVPQISHELLRRPLEFLARN